MSGDVALTSSIRANLLSLQSTNSLLGRTQGRLASGRAVNSVFDDPINFVASQRLNDRANDLGRLLDGISSSLRTVEAANNGATAVTSLLDQAQSIIDSATEEISTASQTAAITGNVDLSGITDFNAVAGIANTDTLTFTVTDSAGAAVTLQNAGVVTINTNDSIEQIVTEINDLNQGLTTPVISATLNTDGTLSVEATNGGDLRVVFDSSVGATSDLGLAQALGFGSIAGAELDGATNAVVAATTVSSNTIDSNALLASGVALQRSAALSTATGFANIAANDTLTLTVNGQTASAAITLNAQTVQGLIDAINNDTNIGALVDATYNDTSGVISIRTLDSTVEDITFSINDALVATDLATNFGFGTGVSDAGGAGNAQPISETVRFGSSAGAILQLEQQFDALRTQLDQIVADTEFRGTNLLSGDTLTTNFNPTRTNFLNTVGVDFTSSGLGLLAADFSTQTNINTFSTARLAATTAVRDFQSTLTGDLNIIATRESFTQSTINTLQSASDDLTLADEETEGARLLALQTRQQLGITSLSLAAQAQQSILRLF